MSQYSQRIEPRQGLVDGLKFRCPWNISRLDATGSHLEAPEPQSICRVAVYCLNRSTHCRSTVDFTSFSIGRFGLTIESTGCCSLWGGSSGHRERLLRSRSRSMSSGSVLQAASPTRWYTRPAKVVFARLSLNVRSRNVLVAKQVMHAADVRVGTQQQAIRDC